MATIKAPRDFWALVERAKLSFKRLESELAALDETGLENFHGLTAVLSADAILQDELYYESADLYLSEDGLEDFGWWVVTQGGAFFEALTTGTMPLQEALAMHMEGDQSRQWKSEDGRQYRETNFLSLAQEVFEDRFGAWTSKREDRARHRAFELRDAEYSQSA